MTATVLAAAGISAFLHASWNLLARQHRAPQDILYGIAVATATICVVFLPVVGLPQASAWRWIASAAVCNVLYLRVLGKAYRHPDFCAVYAIVRAVVPAALFLAGLVLFGERERWVSFIGLAIVVASILVFAGIGRATLRAFDAPALLTPVAAGLVLAVAIFFDIKGLRTGEPSLSFLLSYTAASSLMTAAGVVGASLLQSRVALKVLVTDTATCYGGAVLLLASYLFGMWAYARGPITLVAPVRESGILIAGVLFVLLLRQHVSRVQWVAMSLATLGIVLVQLG